MASPEYIQEKMPHRDEFGRLIVDHAPEVTWSWAAREWERKNRKMGREIERGNCQVVVLTPHANDVTYRLYESLKQKPLGKYSVATTIEQEFPDGDLGICTVNEAISAHSIYIVASILDERDFSRVRRVAGHYKHTLNGKWVTLLCPFLSSTREDKNIELDGQYRPNTINIRAELAGFRKLIDRMVVIEPHSSATQAYAADNEMPLAPLSPWKLMIASLMETGVLVGGEDNEERVRITPDNAVIVRPDKGRNLAAKRIGEYTKIPSVSFDKVRVTGQDVYVYELTEEEQELVGGRIALLYDDEASTMGTIFAIANALGRYRARALAACLVHCKFTPGWEKRIQHPLLTTVLGTDSREPIGNIRMANNFSLVSLEPLLRQIIVADIEGVNFWRDPEFRDMVLQPHSGEPT